MDLILEVGIGKTWKETLGWDFGYDTHILFVILDRESIKKQLLRLKYKILNSNLSQKK